MLESFDMAGGVFSTLKTDIIQISVDYCPPTKLVLISPFADFTYVLGDP